MSEHAIHEYTKLNRMTEYIYDKIMLELLVKMI